MDVVILDHEAETYAAALARVQPAITFHAAHDEAAARAAGAEAEVLVALAHAVSQNLVDAMPRLRWIAALTTGTDHLASLALPAELVVTSARGIHGPQMAELAFLSMIALSRDFRRMQDNQSRAVWERWPQRLLLGKTAVLVGIGAISEEVAARCRAFGMHVVGVSAARTAAPGFDEVLPRARLREAAGRADFLIVLVPYTPETEAMISAEVIAALPRRAILVNLARGRVIDEAALIEALREHRIAGAGLDVFHTEPLPPDSPLWHMPNVIVTPRIGGMSDVYAQQVLPLLAANLATFAAGRLGAMRNLVAMNRAP